MILIYSRLVRLLSFLRMDPLNLGLRELGALKPQPVGRGSASLASARRNPAQAALQPAAALWPLGARRRCLRSLNSSTLRRLV